MKLQDKFFKVEKELNSFIFCRSNVIRDAIKALLTQNHMCMIGEPGIAKSFVIDSLIKRVQVSNFSYLNTPFTKPVEVFGDVDVKKLRETGVREILTSGYLPDVKVCFGDEIWNAENYLNALLNIMNERKFTNGSKQIICPLISYFAASNKYPEKGLEALWDRFLFRSEVYRINNKEDRKAYHMSSAKREKKKVSVTIITEEELYQAIKEVSEVILTEETVDAYLTILENLGNHERRIVISDRRETWIHEVIRVNAWLAGRTSTLPEDCSDIASSIWYDVEDLGVIRKEIAKVVNPVLDIILSVLDKAEKWMSKWKNNEDYVAGSEDEEDPANILPVEKQHTTKVTAAVCKSQMSYLLKSVDVMKVTQLNEHEKIRVVNQLKGKIAEVIPFAMKELAGNSRNRR